MSRPWMVMPVRMFVWVIMFMMVLLVFVTLHKHVELHCTQIRAYHPRRSQLVSFNSQLFQLGFQILQIQPQVEERANGHVSADAGETIEVQGLHISDEILASSGVLTLAFKLLDIQARVKEALRATIRSLWSIDPPDVILNQTPKI